ncbi:HAMP domain-containing sensor histidine kinase [Anaerovorax odorimutans]|uniref:HAMP domain-containing sensor histidine kinase n=1 Tax=Anaerovorax odorimutans TaxID=109327 RepID=UPI0004090A4C|nr:HAMP domain-containing sensor histidine kinase [Anaerovorax odorimutans]
MIVKKFGFFGKVFLYTLLFLLLTIGITVMVFAQQFKDFYDYLQVQQYNTIFQPLKVSISKDFGIDQIVKSANEFHDKNQAFPFSIENKDGYVVYTTKITSDSEESLNSDNLERQKKSAIISNEIDSKRDTTSGTATIDSNNSEKIKLEIQDKNTKDGIKSVAIEPNNESYICSDIDKTQDNVETVTISLDDDMIICTEVVTGSEDIYKKFIKKAVFILCLLLCASIAGAVLFARGITSPIKKLANDTRKMACLEEVSLSFSREDEVGQLAKDVHNMYEKLKYTISKLQDEITHGKEMEENQRYFFSAASHELKTPIAAASALLEGMIAGIGDYNNHPKYLRECLSMMGVQNRIITEILEIVKLSDERIAPHKENVNLLDIIHSLLPEYTTLADKKEQSIIINVPENVFCFTDRKMISNVFSNVIMNAIQNSPSREIIRIWSEVQDDNTIRFCILNTNSHIDEETREKLFQPFYRVDKARSRDDGRGGLGLTIVKKILDSLHITFALEMQNKDVIFWMEIPIHE